MCRTFLCLCGCIFCVVHVGGGVSDRVMLSVMFRGWLRHRLPSLLCRWATTFKNLTEAKEAMQEKLNLFTYSTTQVERGMQLFR